LVTSRDDFAAIVGQWHLLGDYFDKLTKERLSDQVPIAEWLTKPVILPS